VAADVQAAAPDALVATAFQHLPARLLGDLGHELEADVLVCSDHSSAIEVAAALIAKVARLRPLDAGRLSSAAAVESLTAVLLQLNARYRAKTTLKVLGLPG
jgi:predicted dinucleotide-binding enzyme